MRQKHEKINKSDNGRLQKFMGGAKRRFTFSIGPTGNSFGRNEHNLRRITEVSIISSTQDTDIIESIEYPKSLDKDVEYQKRLLGKARELDQAGNELFEQGRYQELLESYGQALKYKEQTLKSADDINAENQQQEQNTTVSKRMRRHLLASVATSINNIGFLLQRLGDSTIDEIMSFYQNSLRIKEKVLGKNHLSIGATHNNIGSVYFRNGDHEEAMTAYQQALEIITSNLGTYHLDVATVHSNIGDIYLATNKLEAARTSYNQALKIRWLELGDGNITDARVIRLLERVATIDMSDATQKLNEKPEYIYDLRDSKDYYPNMDSIEELRDDSMDPVMFVGEMGRNLPLEMFRDQIEMINEMRKFANDDNESKEEGKDSQNK